MPDLFENLGQTVTGILGQLTNIINPSSGFRSGDGATTFTSDEAREEYRRKKQREQLRRQEINRQVESQRQASVLADEARQESRLSNAFTDSPISSFTPRRRDDGLL